jgi:hypothetical protein
MKPSQAQAAAGKLCVMETDYPQLMRRMHDRLDSGDSAVRYWKAHHRAGK